jgi:hypothetical protein
VCILKIASTRGSLRRNSCATLIENLSSVEHSRAALLKAKNSPYTTDEWESILESILLARVLSDGNAALMEGVESVASVEEYATMSIIIRKRTEGITVCLAILTLNEC